MASGLYPPKITPVTLKGLPDGGVVGCEFEVAIGAAGGVRELVDAVGFPGNEASATVAAGGAAVHSHLAAAASRCCTPSFWTQCHAAA